MKKCAICGELFVPEHNAQKFCKKDHLIPCPVCGKQIAWNSLRIVRPCSKECSTRMREQTLLATSNVTNIMQLDSTILTRRNNWINKVHRLLPMKLETEREQPHFLLDENKMQVFVLTERASCEFLKHYGWRISPTFGKIHMSLGLVNDGILYQVLRFEKRPDKKEIWLTDFGTREAYFNPNYYSKLLEFAVHVRGIEEFKCEIPRNIANKRLIDSLSVDMMIEGDYKVYWKINENLVKLTQRDDIEEMLSKYDYVTTDYLDQYRYVSDENSTGEIDDLESFIVQSTEELRII